MDTDEHGYDSVFLLLICVHRCPSVVTISFLFLSYNVELWHVVSEERANGVDHQRLVMPSL